MYPYPIFMPGLPRLTLLLSTYRAAFEVAALNISRLTHLLAVFIRRINREESRFWKAPKPSIGPFYTRSGVKPRMLHQTITV